MAGVDQSAERDAVSRGRGKWGQPNVPHKGWQCVGQYDSFEELGEDEFLICGMCESTQIRFVHIMSNERFPEQLLCGCVCAGHMQEDLTAAVARDKGMRSTAGRRDHFPRRKGWKKSPNGTPHIRVQGYHLMIVAKKGGGFGIGVTPPGVVGPTWGKRRYGSIQDAQKGCFDALTHFQSRRPPS